MDYKEQIHEQVDLLKQHLIWTKVYTSIDGTMGVYGDYRRTDEFGTNLRFDWEMSTESLNGAWKHPRLSQMNVGDYQSAVAELMMAWVEPDLVELVEDSDWNHEDHLLRHMNGIKKRGVEPVSVTINSCATLYEYKRGKDTREYTLYLNLSVKWPESATTTS